MGKRILAEQELAKFRQANADLGEENAELKEALRANTLLLELAQQNNDVVQKVMNIVSEPEPISDDEVERRFLDKNIILGCMPKDNWEAELDENYWLKPEYLHKMIDLLDDTLWEGFVEPQIEAMKLGNPDWFWTEEEADTRWAKKESDDDA